MYRHAKLITYRILQLELKCNFMYSFINIFLNYSSFETATCKLANFQINLLSSKIQPLLNLLLAIHELRVLYLASMQSTKTDPNWYLLKPLIKQEEL